MSTVVTCRMFSTHGFKASYSLVEAGMGGTSVRVLKYTVPSDATSRSSAKMISEPGILEAVRLTRFANMVVRPLVQFTSTKPSKQKQHAVLLSHAHGIKIQPGTGSLQTLHSVKSNCVNACMHASTSFCICCKIVACMQGSDTRGSGIKQSCAFLDGGLSYYDLP